MAQQKADADSIKVGINHASAVVGDYATGKFGWEAGLPCYKARWVGYDGQHPAEVYSSTPIEAGTEVEIRRTTSTNSSGREFVKYISEPDYQAAISKPKAGGGFGGKSAYATEQQAMSDGFSVAASAVAHMKDSSGQPLKVTFEQLETLAKKVAASIISGGKTGA